MTLALRLLTAKLLFRWSLAQAILGPVITTLTFAGVVSLLLSPLLYKMGIPFLMSTALIVGSVMAAYMISGTYLDRGVRLWESQAIVAMVRNPFFRSNLEALIYLMEGTEVSARRDAILVDLRRLLALLGDAT